MKRVISIILVICSLLLVCSCGESEVVLTKTYNKPDKIKQVKSGIVAENDNFTLSVDSSIGNLILSSKKTGKTWSSVPYKFYTEGSEDVSSYAKSHLYSSLQITAVKKLNNSTVERYSYDDVILKNSLYSLKIENGVRFIYFFERDKISIPVDYTLTDEGLSAKVLVNEIAEGDTYFLSKISLLPYFTSAENNTDSYLFVPSGDGALMNVDSGKRSIRKYSEKVYSTDASYNRLYDFTINQECKLPVFASKNIDSSLMGIISEGAELATINAFAGDDQIGFSSVYPIFEVRGKNYTKVRNSGGTTSIVDRYSESVVKVDNITVDYCVLDDDVTYNGMAAEYRDYLKDKGYLSEPEKEAYLYLDFLGGAKINKSFLGLAYTETEPATTVDATADIISDILTYADKGLVARLRGYGKSGLTNDVLGGGFEFDKKIGDDESVELLTKICSENNIALSMDFDLMHYNTNGAGYNTDTDSAKSVNNTPAQSTIYKTVISEASKYNYLIKRDLLPEVTNKATEMVKKYGINGVSLSANSNTIYGDYREQKYYAGANSSNQFAEMAAKFNEENLFVVSDNATDYAAVVSDYIFNATNVSSEYHVFDKDIPFYHMVFKGNVSCATPSINLEANPRETFLKAIATGSALQFSVADTYHKQFLGGNYTSILGSSYDGIKSTISSMYAEAQPFLSKVNGASIVEYSINNGVSYTEFSNGVKVYVNFNDSAVNTPIGSVEALSFKY